MKYEVFKEKFGELSTSEKIAVYNEYCLEHGYLEDAIQDFDEEFFSTYFSNPMEAARATFFGNIHGMMTISALTPTAIWRALQSMMPSKR